MSPDDDLRQQVIDRFGELMPITDAELESVRELKDLLNNVFDDATPAVMRVLYDGVPAVCVVAHLDNPDGIGIQAVALLCDEHIMSHITDVHGDPAVEVTDGTGVTQGNSAAQREEMNNE